MALHFALVGDSDIDRWPKALLPSVIRATTTVLGHSGATLRQVLPHVRGSLERSVAPTNFVILVVCAGENDIGNGMTLVETETYFQELLKIIFDRTDSTNVHLIFLGPKFEPWLNKDKDARKQYIQMSLTFQRCCRNNKYSSQISYIDCLAMFCGESANQPGAVLGGKAVADPSLFDADQLHLSEKGYRIWKRILEDCTANILR